MNCYDSALLVLLVLVAGCHYAPQEDVEVKAARNIPTPTRMPKAASRSQDAVAPIQRSATKARLDVKSMRAKIKTGMSVTDLRSILGDPDRTDFIHDAVDREDWIYFGSDGDISLIVAPRENKVYVLEIYATLRVLRTIARKGMTISDMQKKIAEFVPGTENAVRSIGSPYNWVCHGADGSLMLWVDAKTGKITRIKSEKLLPMQRDRPKV